VLNRKHIKEKYKSSLASFRSGHRLRHGSGILLSFRRYFGSRSLGDCSCSALKNSRGGGWEGQGGDADAS
jgi:hypothetical protein